MVGVKRRILEEVEASFLNHPIYSGKVTVTNKFPYKERLQFGAVLRNTAATQIRMSADNYMADSYSHVRLARFNDYPGLSVEWAKENEDSITKRTDEDISSQADPTQRLFTTSHQILSGPGNTDFADNSGLITVLVNGSSVDVDTVDGINKQFTLKAPAPAGATIVISYYYRYLAEPGLYRVIFTDDHEFYIAPSYFIENELLVEKTTGLETTLTLERAPIEPGSESLILSYYNSPPEDVQIILVRDTEYVIDNTTGIITFLTPVTSGYKLSATYYTEVQPEEGPYTFKNYQEVHGAIPGTVLCMGRRSKGDDLQLVFVTKDRELQARIYGGHWDMSLSLGVIAKDPIQMAEMTDQVINWLWGIRKNALEFEGITLESVEPTGETEEVFIETTGDLYYESSVDIRVMTEWQKFLPYIYKIRQFDISGVRMSLDARAVIKHPTIGYERVV